MQDLVDLVGDLVVDLRDHLVDDRAVDLAEVAASLQQLAHEGLDALLGDVVRLAVGIGDLRLGEQLVEQRGDVGLGGDGCAGSFLCARALENLAALPSPPVTLAASAYVDVQLDAFVTPAMLRSLPLEAPALHLVREVLAGDPSLAALFAEPLIAREERR